MHVREEGLASRARKGADIIRVIEKEGFRRDIREKEIV